MPNIFKRLTHAWNAFRENESLFDYDYSIGSGYSTRPDRYTFNLGNEKSIITSVYTRIGIDVSSMKFRHVRLDEDERFVETIKSGLNNCLNLEANIDQTGRAFIQDVVISMFDEGCVAIVPVDTTINPSIAGSYDILSMRTGKIVQWYPAHVRIELYDERDGLKKQILLSKKQVAIVENPLYAVMNEPNSTLKRLIAKLNLLDVIDQQSGSGKLDLLIHLPFIVKTAAREKQANDRKANIEKQLADSKYGIAYVDASEKVTQLNRPVENNLMGQIEFLTRMLYSQLGLDQTIFQGTADEKTMLNYYNLSVEPVASAIVDGMIRSFLTKTARSQGQSIKAFRDPFRMASVSELAEASDSFSRNEIFTANEIRGFAGYRPSKDKGADELRNKNLNPVSTPNGKVNKGESSNDDE